MSIVLSHDTALEIYRSSLAPSANYKTVPFRLLSSPISHDVSWLRSLSAKETNMLLHYVVPSASRRRGFREAKSHVCGIDMEVIPLRQAASESFVCVVTPEVLFLQMAAKLSPIELMKLGYELCGSYSLSDADSEEDEEDEEEGESLGFTRRQPLTSVGKLSAYFEPLSQVRCVQKARSVLRYVVDGCASPREAELCMLLVLPCRLGGYGLGKPLVGHTDGATRNKTSLLPGKHGPCDLLWPLAGVALEYGVEPPEAETVRRRAPKFDRRMMLGFSDIEVIPLTNQQIEQVGTLDSVVSKVARRHGRKLRRDQHYDFFSRQQGLREAVLGKEQSLKG